MRWRYGKYYNHRKYAYRPNFYYSEKEIDFTCVNLDYTQFLLQEFFNADLKTRENIYKYYLDNYGSRSFAYLKRKYSEWANGDYHLTDLMSGRILEIMPKFLSSEAKHKIGIHQFMSTIKKATKAFEKAQKSRYYRTKHITHFSELQKIFENEYDKIREHSFESLKLYNNRTDMLTKDEIIQALEISKYILEIKLQKLYDQIERDFNIFLIFIKEFKSGTFNSTFNITLFNITVEITHFIFNDIKIPKFELSKVSVNSSFIKYSDKYLAYELAEIQNNANKKTSQSFLNNNDLKIFINQFRELCKGRNEVKYKSSFIGESGVLSVSARYVPPQTIRTSIVYTLARLLGYLVVTILLVIIAILNEAFVLLFIGAIFGGLIVLNLVNEELEELKSLRKQYKTYI